MSQTVDRPPKTDKPPLPTFLTPAPASRRVRPAQPRTAPWQPTKPEASRRPSLISEEVEEMLDERQAARLPLRRAFVLSPFLRLRICAFVVTLFAAAIIVQLFTLQVQDRYQAKERAARDRVYESELPASRGLIRDANGLVLASNIWVYNVYAAPSGLTASQSERIALKLSPLLATVPPDKLKAAVTSKKTKDPEYNLVAAAIDNDTAEKIKAMSLPGIVLEPKPRRMYPNITLMGPLLGFTNYENQGAYGIEGRYNKELRGVPGTRMAEHDRDGNPIVLGQIQLKPTIEGSDLSLTLDSSIQYMVEREVKKGMELYQAEKGMAIVADPQTGAILAWASFPNYDPNEFYKTDPALLKDPLVSDVYEPGSTFKILTAAIGIDTGTITPDTNAGNLPGCVIKYGRTICNFDKVGYPNQTPVKTLERSSNVGAMWIAERYGPDKYYDYIKRFGIGSQTGIDLSGEGEGILRTNKDKGWGPTDFLTNAFGQSVAVTPLQLVQAVSAVANGGKLMRPYVVSKVSRNGQTVSETKPTLVRQVISPESAKTTTNMLVNAVRQGETRLADVKGYRVAGKTGTTTLYDSALTIGSTIAYAPADNPRFIVLVRYDKTKTTPWGSNTAAPVVKTITENLLAYYSIPPTEAVEVKPKP